MTLGKIRANLRSLSVLLLILIGSSAIFSGFNLVNDPSGEGLGLHTIRLSFSPFDNYTIPGLLLFVVIGVPSLACAVFTAFRWKQAPDFLVLQGWFLVIWILVQIALLQEFNLLHVLCLLTGIIWLYTGNLLKKRPIL